MVTSDWHYRFCWPFLLDLPIYQPWVAATSNSTHQRLKDFFLLPLSHTYKHTDHLHCNIMQIGQQISEEEDWFMMSIMIAIFLFCATLSMVCLPPPLLLLPSCRSNEQTHKHTTADEHLLSPLPKPFWSGLASTASARPQWSVCSHCWFEFLLPNFVAFYLLTVRPQKLHSLLTRVLHYCHYNRLILSYHLFSVSTLLEKCGQLLFSIYHSLLLPGSCGALVASLQHT